MLIGWWLMIAGCVTTASSCTTFVLNGGGNVYFARNLDWMWGNGLVIVNQRGIQKRSLVRPGDVSASWVSKYGSITFNQFGQEMPYGGMNEAGLVVECMWLDQTQYAPTDTRPAINLLQWIQYQLDTCRSVDEVVACDSKLRVYAPNNSARIHYLLTDAQGQCVTVEFLSGKMVVHRGQELPFSVLANDPYELSVQYAHNHLTDENVWDHSSSARFARACLRAKQFKPGVVATNVQYAFDTLDEIEQGSTVWSIVYDISNRRIYYHTRVTVQNRCIDFHDVSFGSAKTPVQYVNIDDSPASDGKLKFRDLSDTEQRNYLENFVGQPAVKQKFGDLMPQIRGQLEMLGGFHPGDVGGTIKAGEN